MEYHYRIAGVGMRVLGPEQELYTDHGVLSPFRDNAEHESDYTLEFDLVDQLTLPEEESVYTGMDRVVYRTGDSVITYLGCASNLLEDAYIRICRQNNYCRVQCKKGKIPIGITPKTVLRAMDAEHMIVRNKGIILHASYIRHGGKAILFTAPSGTGKSTQADLWVRHRGAELINGDRAVIKVEQGVAYAYGIPFSGSSGVGKNAKLPVEAIVYLRQSEECGIRKLKGYEAFRRLWEGCTLNIWNKTDVEVCVQTATDVLGSVPFYCLSCTLDVDAVTTLEDVLYKDFN